MPRLHPFALFPYTTLFRSNVVAAAAIHGERAHPAAPVAGDDLARDGRERQPLLEREQAPEAAILVVGLADQQPLDAQLLVLLAQAQVLGADVLPVEVGLPGGDGHV